MRLAEDETAIVVLPHQAPYREERGKILRQRRCKRNPRRRHPEDNDKNQVQKYVEHPCRGKIVQRMLCVALRAKYRASEVVDEYSRRACEVYDHILNRLLKRVRDFAQVKGNGVIDRGIADYALSCLEIDRLGLDNVDRRMLEVIIRFYGGGPVGLETLAATVGEESVTIEDVYEPYLMQIGFLSRTPRGRCVTKAAYDHLGLPYGGDTASGVQLDVFSDSN